jgi:hypothetical protein
LMGVGTPINILEKYSFRSGHVWLCDAYT